MKRQIPKPGRWLWLVALVMVLAAPSAVWYAGSGTDARVLIVDKTVPHANYREHSSLVWVLNYLKAPTEANGDQWHPSMDYLGFYPERRSQSGRAYGARLTHSALSSVDLLYIADAYGVYEDDYDNPSQMSTHQDYSERIYGGFDAKEVEAIESFVNRGGELIAEFNTFASPTIGDQRKRLENILGVKWTEWSGRFFPNLEDDREVPQWAMRNWQTQYGQPWNFKGPGWLFAHEDSRLFVLEQGRHINPDGLRIHVVDQDNALTREIEKSVPFHFWFDVVEPMKGFDVLASYRLDTTEQGRKLLTEFGLTDTFPAVVRSKAEPMRLYLAGDMSDLQFQPGSFRVAGLPWLMRKGTAAEMRNDQRYFFWEFYVPLMTEAISGVNRG